MPLQAGRVGNESVQSAQAHRAPEAIGGQAYPVHPVYLLSYHRIIAQARHRCMYHANCGINTPLPHLPRAFTYPYAPPIPGGNHRRGAERAVGHYVEHTERVTAVSPFHPHHRIVIERPRIIHIGGRVSRSYDPPCTRRLQLHGLIDCPSIRDWPHHGCNHCIVSPPATLVVQQFAIHRARPAIHCVARRHPM